MNLTWTILAIGALFLATLTLAQQQQTTPAGNSSQVVLASYDNSKVLLEQGSPEFILWDTSLCNSVETCPETLITKLTNIYETDAFGTKVPHRAASDILNIPLGGWSSTRLPIGSPAVDAMEAYYRIPFKQSMPTCDGMLGQPSAPGGGVILELFVVGEATNVTTSTGTTLASTRMKTELIPGNVKWNIRVDKWPFCGSNDKLHLDVMLRSGATNDKSSQISSPSSASTGNGIVIKSYEQVAQDLQMEYDLINSVLPREVISPPEVIVFEGQQLPFPQALAPQSEEEFEEGQQQQQSGGRKLKTAPNPGPSAESWPMTGPRSGSTPGNSTITAPMKNPKERRAAALEIILASPGVSQPQKAKLIEKFSNSRPVYGLGRRDLSTEKGNFIFFNETSNARQAKVDAPAVALLDGNVASVVVTAAAPENNDQLVMLRIQTPVFANTMVYDPVAVISETEERVDGEIRDAIMAAAVEQGGDTAMVGGVPSLPPVEKTEEDFDPVLVFIDVESGAWMRRGGGGVLLALVLGAAVVFF
jgi:hypothetical protein